MFYQTPEIDCRLRLYEKFEPSVYINKVRGAKVWFFSIIVDGKVVVEDYTFLSQDYEYTKQSALAMGKKLKNDRLLRLELESTGDRLYVKQVQDKLYQIFCKGKLYSIAAYRSLDEALAAAIQCQKQRDMLAKERWDNIDF